ncbi:CAP domain-containing protein [Brevibacillus massiliensis]|uniref:CAP domain-containing protein n=1 Tax=Brevibacillus massiliensis TaxID=1118054 RepID=UPI0002EA41BD|nr:CAP-associated domain-containing protein [Brevibacillus massiliensis]
MYKRWFIALGSITVLALMTAWEFRANSDQQKAIGKGPQTDTPVVIEANSNPPAALPETVSGRLPTVAAAAIEQRAVSLFGIALGDTEQQALSKLGQPQRRDPSPFGYVWHVYNQDFDHYLQVGIADGKVVDLYSNAPAAAVDDIGVGTDYQTLAQKYEVKDLISFTYKGVNVELTNQAKERPLVLDGGTPIIFYLDKPSERDVSAIRLLDKLILLRGGYYEMKWTYTGDGPSFDAPVLTLLQQQQIDTAHARQIFDLVNVSRYRNQLPPLDWNEQVASVAQSHSHDMSDAHFFDHISASTGLDPFERLKFSRVAYQAAGENIAAGYPDAIEAHEGWMNSPSHRKNILSKEFTQLGVGVYDDYYTEDFITPKAPQ